MVFQLNMHANFQSVSKALKSRSAFAVSRMVKYTKVLVR